MSNSQSDLFLEVDLVTVMGGNGPTAAQQAELRGLAKQYCPKLYSQQRSAPITRPLAERCLDEAGYGAFKGQLDKYFSPTRR